MNRDGLSVQHQLCAWCRTIFKGPLKCNDSLRSIRVDCRPRFPAPVPLPVEMNASTEISNGEVELKTISREQTEQKVSTNLPYLPPEMYICDYNFVHLRSNFEAYLSDLDKMLGSDMLPLKDEDQAESALPWRRYGTHHLTVTTFKSSVLSECHICTGIWRRVSNIGWPDLEQAQVFDTGFTTYGVYYFPKTTSFEIVFHIGLDEEHPNLQYDPQKTALHFICCARTYFDGHFKAVNKKAGSSISSVNWKLVSNWIHQCDKTHKCVIPSQEALTYPPARLLYVGRRLVPQLKLIDTNNSRLRGPYATLSYCWGSGVSVRLLSSNFSEFHRGISQSTLPKTLGQAVTVARRLGIRYLWIDALCIIQDSSDDWNREAPKMADIYSHSYCNIAATHAQSCEDGLFADRGIGKSEMRCVEASWDDIECSELDLLDNEFWIRKVDKAPLGNRGWALQERFLSPRTIHFGDDQVLWEYYETMVCEAFPEGLISGMKVNTRKRRLNTNQKPLKGSSTDVLESYRLWNLLLAKFSSSKLTKESDKLVAISGLARKLHDETNDEYVAGIWWNRLPMHLIWRPMSHVIKPLQYRAPSWSWASVDGEIVPHKIEEDLVDLIDKIEYHIEYVTDDIYGQVKSGSIRLSGRLFPHKFTFSGIGWKMLFNGSNFDREIYGEGSFFDVEDEQDYSANEYYCLPVVLYEEFTRILCLTLQSTGRTQGEYSRVGMMSFDYDMVSDVMYDKSTPYELNPGLYDSTSTFSII